MPVGFLVCMIWQCCCLWSSGPTGAPTVISYPVAEDAGAGVGGLDVSDEWEVKLFGENQQQQALHPHWCDLDTDRDGERLSYRLCKCCIMDCTLVLYENMYNIQLQTRYVASEIQPNRMKCWKWICMFYMLYFFSLAVALRILFCVPHV